MTAEHEILIDSLPAYRRGQLDTAATDAVAAHLQQCVACRAELQLVDELQYYFKRKFAAEELSQQWLQAQRIKQRELPPPLAHAAFDRAREQANFDKLWQRIEQLPAAPTTKPTKRLLLAAAMLVIAVGISLQFGISLQRGLLQPNFRTLANTGEVVPCDALRVRFVDNLAASDLQYLLRAIDAQIIAGPSPHGVYTVRAQQTTTAAAQRLRMHPAVLLVEPVSCAR